MSQVLDFDMKSIILKEFDRNGFLLRPTCLLKLMEKYISAEVFFSSADSFRLHIKQIITQIKNIHLNNLALESNVIDDSILEEALKLMHLTDPFVPKTLESSSSNAKLHDLLNQKLQRSMIVLDAFTDFSDIRDTSQNLFGSADDKIGMHLKRFQFIRDKMSKNPRYIFEGNIEASRKLNSMKNNKLLTTLQKNNKTSSEIIIESSSTDMIILEENEKIEEQTLEIIEIGSLVGSSGQKNIMGVLFELELQTYYLQDNYLKVKLNITKSKPSLGFILPGNIYIVQGEYLNENFIVTNFLMPDYETRKTTVQNYGNFDFFGATRKLLSLYSKVLNLELEKKVLDANNESIDKKLIKLKEFNLTQQVVLGCFDLTTLQKNDALLTKSCVAVFSNFLLSNECLNKFEIALKGFENLQPLVFVLMGEFSIFSEIKDKKEYNEYNQNLELFLNLVKKFPKFCQNSCWIFISGTKDVGLNVLPREGLPSYIYEKIRNTLPLSFNCTNPCRISIFGKEFIFSRNDIIKDLRRNSVLKSDEKFELDRHFADTVIGQHHLSPINSYAQPVFWKFDSALYIRKLPNFLILADSFCRQFERKIGEEGDDCCFVNNPGNFAKTTCFNLIYPVLNTVQICKINK